MNQKISSEGCGGILTGAILGVVAGIVVGGILDSAFAGFIVWCFCVWVGGNIADGTFASKFNLSQRPDTKSVNVHYTNSKGSKRNIFVNQNQVQLDGNKVILEKISGGSLTLNRLRIHNPEVLGLTEKETPLPASQELPPLPTPQKLPQPIKTEEGPPILEPEEFIVGDMSGTELLYTRSDGSQGVIYFDPNSLELTENRAIISPYGTNEEYAILLEKVLNPEVLVPHPPSSPVPDSEEEPPILEPTEHIVGDISGRKLLYTRKDLSQGVIYFDPNSVQLTPTRAVISPYETNEEYAILRNKILNPEVLVNTPVVTEPVKPWTSAEFKPGTRIVIEEVPLDSYEAAQIMRKIKPDLGPFEILESLKYNRETILQGYDEPQAKDIKEDLESAGCTVYLHSIVPEEPHQPGPLVSEPVVQIARPPTEAEFALIRNARDHQYDSIKTLIESNPLELNARDQAGSPLIFRMRSPKIVGLLIDGGADIHAQDMQGNTILHQGAMQKDVSQMLIQFGVDIDARGENGHTPLTRAAQLRLYPLTKTLVEQGADIHSKNDIGENALQLAERHQDTEGNKIAALLREYGAGPSPTPQSKRPPTEDEFFEIRCAENPEDFFRVDELFKTTQININARDQLGNPIFFQVRSPEILGLLMDQGIDIHSKNRSRENALHYCHREVSLDVCEMLIQFGVDINAVDDQGETPLIRAAAMGNYAIAKKLIGHGANINYRTTYGETALLAAENNQWKHKPQSTDRAKDCPKIAALLRENGAT